MIMLLKSLATQFSRLFWHVSFYKKQQSSFITKCDRLLLQCGSGITKCNRLLLQSVPGIVKCGRLYYKVRQVLKCDSYYKVRRNTGCFFTKNRGNNYKHEVTNLLLKPMRYNYHNYVTYVAFYIFSITCFNNMGLSELKNMILFVEVTNMFQSILFEYLNATFVVHYEIISIYSTK